MSVYVIASYEVNDWATYQQYILAADLILAKYQGELLIADDNAQVIEGQNTGTNVVIRFPSAEQAMNFYNDPEYTEVKKIRYRATTNNKAVLAQKFVIPEA